MNPIRTILEELRQVGFNDGYDGAEGSISQSKEMTVDQALVSLAEIVEAGDIEAICEQVHKAYCKYHLEHKGIEYWTKGDYSKLNEEGKEYDRRTVRAVVECIAKIIRGERYGKDSKMPRL